MTTLWLVFMALHLLVRIQPATGASRWSELEQLEKEGPDNSSEVVTLNHVYYTSRLASSRDLWVDLDQQEPSSWKTHGSLTSSRPQSVRLSFPFPFYGHMLTDVTVTAGGFIYTGETTHSLLGATQYIAPLMADFNASLSHLSSVFFFDNGSALVVQWRRLHLRDEVGSGAFTFQASLLSDGRIVFAYREVPVDVGRLDVRRHPVKVGVSDAFVVVNALEQIPEARRRTIYEYHKVDVLQSWVSSRSSVELLPQPTCLQFSSCASCTSALIGFNCSWCRRLQRCSSGFDRHRQDWVDRGCPEERRELPCEPPLFPGPGQHGTTPAVTSASGQRGSSGLTSSTLGRKISTEQTPTSGPGLNDSRRRDQQLQVGLLTIIVIVAVVMATGVLLSLYMYHHPTSSTSIFFMERRPARWPTLKFKRGSCHLSYAEVEAPDKDGAAVIDPKQSFVMAERRESEQKEGFIVPDQRERFLVLDGC